MARKKRSIINGLGARLKEARESSGWRQIDAAMQLEITESSTNPQHPQQCSTALGEELINYYSIIRGMI